MISKLMVVPFLRADGAPSARSPFGVMMVSPRIGRIGGAGQGAVACLYITTAWACDSSGSDCQRAPPVSWRGRGGTWVARLWRRLSDRRRGFRQMMPQMMPKSVFETTKMQVMRII
jgi:hypothetical protein